MASINGISIKELKKFTGPDGEHLYCGDIYCRGRRLGSWAQKAGREEHPDIFRFDTKDIEKEAEAYAEYLADAEGNSRTSESLSSFMQELIRITEAEKVLEEDKNARAALCTTGYRRMTVSVINECVSTKAQRDRILEIGGGFCNYRFTKEMPDWACRNVSTALYCRGELDPVYSRQGCRYAVR